MRGLKRTLKKSVYDVIICFGLLFPDIYPELRFADDIRTTFVVIMFIATVLGVLGALLMFSTAARDIVSEKYADKIDLWYRIYEPTSDLALTICMIISGHPVLAGVYMFVGVFQRASIYNAIDNDKE